MSTLLSCLACGAGDLRGAASLGTTPAFTGALFPTRETARDSASGMLDLAVCPDCGHVQNIGFDPDLVRYDVRYDNSLHFSGTFQQFADQVVQRLVDHYDIRAKHVVEIGSGKGDFLAAITAAGGNTGTGYDPTTEPDTVVPGVTFVRDYFQPGQHVDHYDLLACRHVLEHLDDPAGLLVSLAESAPDGALYYFEVPAAEFNLGPDDLWDCIYPHVSYFSAGSLAALLDRCGFEIISLERSFHDQFLSVEARVGRGGRAPDPELEAHLRVVGELGQRYRAAVARWDAKISAARQRNQTVVLWGAGSRGVIFLNAVDPEGMLAAVDINPRKWGRFLPGGGHEVIPPTALKDLPVSLVVVPNPVYRDEIVQSLADMDVDAEVVTV